jgi:hypothetical protein
MAKAAVCSKPRPEAIVAPAPQAPVGPLMPDTKQVGAVSGVVEIGAGNTVRLKMFTNSADIRPLDVAVVGDARDALVTAVLVLRQGDQNVIVQGAGYPVLSII